MVYETRTVKPVITNHDLFCQIHIPLNAGGASAVRIFAGFSTVHAGDMALTNNGTRDHLFRILGMEDKRLFSLAQSHSRSVRTCTDNSPPVEEGDGAVTRSLDRVLSVTVADCLPIYLFDRRTGVFALVHSGWKGTGIAVDGIDIMEREYGCSLEDIEALIGPGIDDCCYNVPEERARHMESAGNNVVARRNGQFYLSLRNANCNLLNARGVRRISVVDLCTSCSLDLGSFRRQGPASFTRMVALMGYY